MQLILLSGGSGKRLWPLSNEVRSKQFLKVINSENEIQSMLQRVYGQLSKIGLADDVTIATSKTQVDSIKSQLKNKVNIVVEPERRNTFPAIALSVAYLYFEKHCGENETVVVLPVDPYVDNGYFETLNKVDVALKNNAADIILMGVVPTYPSEKYGYIVPSSTEDGIIRVARFKEKPSLEVAKQLISDGGLWNCGVFGFKVGYIINMLKSLIEFDSYEDVLNQYQKLEKTSFDYAVVEKAASVAAIPYSGEWKDLGTWNTLTEVMKNSSIGNVVLADDCKNTHVINELDIPVVAMGAKDMVIAVSPDGILVADKEQSSYIKKYVEDIDQRPMFEEKSWGEYKVLDITISSQSSQQTKSTTKRKTIKAGMTIPETKHTSHLEVWTVISGKCVIKINGRKHDAFQGDTFTIEKEVLHSLTALEETTILEVQIMG